MKYKTKKNKKNKTNSAFDYIFKNEIQGKQTRNPQQHYIQIQKKKKLNSQSQTLNFHGNSFLPENNKVRTRNKIKSQQIG